jgi:tetratricopeptide (TPR) repeat protein
VAREADVKRAGLLFAVLLVSFAAGAPAGPPSAGGSCLAEATALYARQSYADALAKLDCAEKAEPKNPEVYNTRGAVLLAQGSKQDAIQQFSRAIQLAPTDSRWRSNRGGAYKAAGDFAAAEADLSKALELDPRNAAAWYTRGNLYGEQKRLDAAIADYARALALEPDHEKARYSRGYALALKGDHAGAIQDFTAAIRLNGGKADYYNRRGMAWLESADLERALADLDQALRLEPQNKSFLANRDRIVQARDLGRTKSPPTATETGGAATGGQPLAAARIGPAGGVLESAGAVSIRFQPGSLAGEESLTLSQMIAADGVRLYQVEGGRGGHLDLQKAAELSFAVPPGESPSDILVVAETMPQLWFVLPSRYDAKTGRISAATGHFSGVGTYNAVKRGVIGFFGGVLLSGVVIVGTTTALPVATGLLIMGAAGAAGAAVVNPLWEEATRLGYDQHLSVSMTPGKTDFTFHFSPSQFKGEHQLWTLGLNKKGQAISATPGTKTLEQIIGLHQKDLQGDERSFGPHEIVSLIRVPERLWLVVKALIEAKLYFSLPDADYRPPADIEVLLTDKLPYTRGSQDDGEWDGKFLKINIDSALALVNSSGQASPAAYLKLKAYAGHEYWHAIWDKNGYRPQAGLPWLNDALATAFETEIAPGFDGTFVPYPGSAFAQEAEHGLLHNVSPYALWPIGRYLLRAPGATRAESHARVLEYVTGKRGVPDLAGELGLWSALIGSITEREREIADPLKDTRALPGRPDILVEHSVRSGWSVLGPADLLQAVSTSPPRNFGRLELGSNALPGAPPLSYFVRTVKTQLPEIAGLAGSTPQRPALVVRREPGAGNEQLIAHAPSVSPEGGPAIGYRRSERQLVRRSNRLALDPKWLLSARSKTGELLVPIGFLRNDARDDSPPPEPVLVYFLEPPRNIRATWRRGNDLRLEWDEPSWGQNLTARQVLSGYRFVIQVGDQVRELPERFIEAGNSSAELSDDELFPLNVDRPLDPASQAFVGLVSVDKVIIDDQGQPLSSPTGWAKNAAQSAAALKTLYCRADCSPQVASSSGCQQFPLHVYRDDRKIVLESLGVPYPYHSTTKDAQGREAAHQGVDQIRFQQFTGFEYGPDGAFGRAFAPDDVELRSNLGARLGGKVEVSGRWGEGTASFTVRYPDVAFPDSQWERDRRGAGGTITYRCDTTDDTPASTPASVKQDLPDTTILFPSGM